MQPPHQPPMNGQHAPLPPVPWAPPQQQQQVPPTQYYQAPPQYYQPGQPGPPHAPPPAMLGQTQQKLPLQYAPPPPHQYAPPPPQYGAQVAGGSAPGDEEIRSLWIGDLQYWMDDAYLFNAFAPMGQQVASVKIIRNKHSGHSEGYGFIEFHSRAAAEYALVNFNGQMMPSVHQAFKLNWASCSTSDRRGDDGSELLITQYLLVIWLLMLLTPCCKRYSKPTILQLEEPKLLPTGSLDAPKDTVLYVLET